MSQDIPQGALFDAEPVFEVDDFMYFYSEDLTDERADFEAAGWVKLLKLDSPIGILDLACGFGRIANRLAALGHSVTGVDLTPGFLELAREDAAGMGVQVNYRAENMRRISYAEEFDCVLILFTSFGYFDDAGNLLVMKNVARALKPGGLLGFDIPNRDVVVRDLPSVGVVDKGGDVMINRLSFDALTGHFHNERIVFRDGIRKDKPFSIRMYSATEIRDLLLSAGLEVQNIYGGFDSQPLSGDSRTMLVVARKPHTGL